jgi:hypothetical protein
LLELCDFDLYSGNVSVRVKQTYVLAATFQVLELVSAGDFVGLRTGHTDWRINDYKSAPQARLLVFRDCGIEGISDSGKTPGHREELSVR